MGKRQKSGSFAASLEGLGAWFERKKRVLPWRDEPSLYRVWISEIMLQQTQVITVVPYFERFMARFPTLEALAKAPQEDVLAQWAGLGYYSRARNLHKAAQQMVAAGGFPRDREGWLEISGVGDYTAGAILSIALNQPEAILDGNVERVLSRVRKVTRVRGDAAYKARLWRLSRAFVVRGHERGVRPSVLNQALMELGATTCTPRKPLCVFCPLQGVCRAFVAGEQEAYPPRKKPKEWLRVREELHCVLDGGGRVLLRRREAGEWRAGLWDLLSVAPGAGGKRGLEKVGTVETKHVVTRHKIERVTHVWRVKAEAEKAAATRLLRAAEDSGDGTRWISVEEPEVAVGSALKRTLQAVRERFEGRFS
jgi:A/G-specific adenine glycosylase